MKRIPATFVFCEGEHDVAFCHLILKHVLNARRRNTEDTCAPWPIGKIVRTFLSKRIEDSTTKFLRYAHCYDCGDRVVFLYKTEGKDAIELSKKLIREMTPYLPGGMNAAFTDFAPNGTDLQEQISEVNYLFVYDHDEKSFEDLVAWWKSCYGAVEGLPSWTIQDQVDYSSTKGVIFGDKAVFGWSTGLETNTLENILMSVFKEVAGLPVDASSQFVCHDAQWSWKPPSEDRKSLSAITAACNKAILTTAGQRHRPGRSLAAIVQDCLKKERSSDVVAEKVRRFSANEHVRGFSDFLSRVVNGRPLQLDLSIGG